MCISHAHIFIHFKKAARPFLFTSNRKRCFCKLFYLSFINQRHLRHPDTAPDFRIAAFRVPSQQHWGKTSKSFGCGSFLILTGSAKTMFTRPECVPNTPELVDDYWTTRTCSYFIHAPSFQCSNATRGIVCHIKQLLL